ncbi:MAG TPA: exopolysaccharide biosynthesis polyprenyl glycosylphosphotransferase [Gammaproteobacteria bacterium]|jgi:exopolysaccharide biosynthesis polyprenyl glycosylphosphotransferase
MSERVAILGTGSLAHKLVLEYYSRRGGHAELYGVITESRDVEPPFDCPRLGALSELKQILSKQRLDRVIVATDEQYGQLAAELLVEMQAVRDLEVETGLDAYERLTGKLAIESLTANSVLFSSTFRPSRAARWFARGFSFTVAAVAAVIFLPAMALLAACIALDSRGPVLFVQERVGLGGKRFRLFKFRSMHDTADKHSEWAADNQQRVTRAGRWLRKFRLDELPQFFNVLRGDMNLVGPRPHPDSNRRLFILVSRNTPECGEQIPYYSLRSSIRPGITGWAQVRYKYANGLDEEIEKLRYDLHYIKHYSIWLDMRILFETVKVVLLGHRRLEQAVKVASVMDDGLQPSPPSQPLLPGLAAALQARELEASLPLPRRQDLGSGNRLSGMH